MTVNSKNLPQRTCIACRQVRGKKALIRLVKTEKGIVEIDVLAKKPGRGAYLCPQKTCWESALRKDRLDYALRTRLRDDNRQALREYGRNLEES
ncbi:MAG: hypothetical protein A2Z77_02895 [Chloroflexi bacterium RBG_13_51_36]|nr:MAG: hypothetical protein A2Z77_02895 [Chloroflexi bacterium RBG_13_51_36]